MVLAGKDATRTRRHRASSSAAPAEEGGSTCEAEEARCHGVPPKSVVSSFRDSQEEAYNNDTANSWDSFNHHRNIVMSLLQQEAKRLTATSKRLCILGAGNGNDINLAKLLRLYTRIDLLDIDGDALERGIHRQLSKKRKMRERVFPHMVDAIGIPDGVDPASIGRLLGGDRVAVQIGEMVENSCDVVVGACVASQLVLGLKRRMESDGKYTLPVGDMTVIHALLNRYVDTLVRMARPGGNSVILHLSDLTHRSDARVRSSYDLDEIVNQQIRRGDFFSGCNPGFFLKPKLHAELDVGAFVTLHQYSDHTFWTWCPSPIAETYCLVTYAIRLARI